MQPVIITDEVFRHDMMHWLPDIPVFVFGADAARARKQVIELRKKGMKEFLLLFNPLVNLTENKPVAYHINLTHENPLIGPKAVILGQRFPDMSRVYEKTQSPGVIIVQGNHPGLESFRETAWPVRAGVFEAIALKASGATIYGWLVGKLEELYMEITNLLEELCSAEA